jgi:hypothetical protein
MSRAYHEAARARSMLKAVPDPQFWYALVTAEAIVLLILTIGFGYIAEWENEFTTWPMPCSAERPALGDPARSVPQIRCASMCLPPLPGTSRSKGFRTCMTPASCPGSVACWPQLS